MAPMKESRWRVELQAAATDKDVLNVARDYVALLAGENMDDLPRDLRPGPLAHCEEISEWALKLVQASLSLGPNEAGVARLRDIGDFFAAASARLSEIHSRARRRW
jgi:hypothetical protein